MTNSEAADILDRLLNDERTYNRTLTNDCLTALEKAIDALDILEPWHNLEKHPSDLPCPYEEVIIWDGEKYLVGNLMNYKSILGKKKKCFETSEGFSMSLDEVLKWKYLDM